MFCVKFSSVRPVCRGAGRTRTATRNRALAHSSPRALRISRNRARSRLSWRRKERERERDSEDSAVLDETDAPSRIIATLTRDRPPCDMYALAFRFPPSPLFPWHNRVSIGSLFLFLLSFLSSSFFRARKLTALSSRRDRSVLLFALAAQ